MKFKFLPISLFVTLILFNTACTKQAIDKDFTPTPSSPGKLLVKVYQIDSTLPASKDTVYRESFAYDNLNRLIEKKDFAINRDGDSSYLSITNYKYNITDTFAFQTTRKTILHEIGKEFNDTAYYNFLNGKYANDSINFSGLTHSTTNFTYGSGLMVRNFKSWYTLLPYSAKEKQNIYQTKLNGDVTYQIDTLIGNADNNSIFTYQVFETNVSYLANPNPYYKIATPNCKGYFNRSIGNFVDDYAPRNLISEQIGKMKNWNSNSADNATLSTISIKYDYSFRIDGYPIEAIATFNRDNIISKTKFVFVYN